MNEFEKYMTKEAGILSGLAEGLGEASGKTFAELLPYVAAMPLVAGGAAGWLTSKATSPSGADIEALQKEILLKDLEHRAASGAKQLHYKEQLKAMNEALGALKKRRGKDPFLRM